MFATGIAVIGAAEFVIAATELVAAGLAEVATGYYCLACYYSSKTVDSLSDTRCTEMRTIGWNTVGYVIVVGWVGSLHLFQAVLQLVVFECCKARLHIDSPV